MTLCLWRAGRSSFRPMGQIPSSSSTTMYAAHGVCLRAYTQYDDEVDTNEGEDAETSVREWSDVGDYMDKHMV